MPKNIKLNIRILNFEKPDEEEVEARVLKTKFCGYTFFIYKSYRFGDKKWIITEYETGGKVESVKYQNEANDAIAAILEKVGADKFRSTIEKNRTTFGTVNQLP